MSNEPIWKAWKRNAIGLPWTFTVYILTDNVLFENSGFINRSYEEIELYRIKDVKATSSFWQGIFGMGTVECHSTDATKPLLKIKNVKNFLSVRTKISDAVRDYRLKMGVTVRELTGAVGDNECEVCDHSDE